MPCKHLWVKLITKAFLSTEMLQTKAGLDGSRRCKESHRIITEVILIVKDCDLYSLISCVIHKETENWEIKATDVSYNITNDNNDYEEDNSYNSYFISADQFESSQQLSSRLPCFLDGIPGEARGRHH